MKTSKSDSSQPATNSTRTVLREPTLFLFPKCTIKSAISVHVPAQISSGCGTSFVLTTERASLPITVIDDFAFLHAEVNVVQGKMMFDIGIPQALVLDHHLLKELGPAKVEGQARVGSGQTDTITTRDCIHSVSVPGFTTGHVSFVESDDLDFIDKDITPDFPGFMGHQGFVGYPFELDYARRSLTFEKSVQGSRSTLLDRSPHSSPPNSVHSSGLAGLALCRWSR